MQCRSWPDLCNIVHFMCKITGTDTDTDIYIELQGSYKSVDA